MEKDEFARSIREIPFRLMAKRANIDQNTFLSTVYKVKCKICIFSIIIQLKITECRWKSIPCQRLC